MDTLLASSLATGLNAELRNRRVNIAINEPPVESFNAETETEQTEFVSGLQEGYANTIRSTIWKAFGLLVGVYAAYLSWSCNSALGRPGVYKAICSLFAFMFGLTYLIFYWMFASSSCKAVMKRSIRKPTA